MTLPEASGVDRPPSPTPLRPLAIAAIGSSSGLVPAFLVAALAVQLQADLHFGQLQLGVATGAFFVTAGLSAVLGGRLADRLGWRTAVLVAAGCTALGLLGIVVGARSYGTLLAALAVAAAGNAVAQPTSNLILAREIHDLRMGLAFGIKQASVPLATLIAGASVPVFAATVGWRAAFACALVLPLVAGLLALGHPPPPPSRHRARGAGRLRGTGTWVVGAALAAAQVGALNTFAVVTAVASGMPESAAGWLLAGASLFGLAGRILLGWTIDVRAMRPLYMVAALLGVGAVGCATMAVGSPLAVGCGLMLAVTGGWGWGGVFLYAIVKRHPDAPASASGAVQAGISIGLGSGPLAFGALLDASGPRLAWTVTAVITAAAAVWMLGVGRRESASPSAVDSPSATVYS